MPNEPNENEDKSAPIDAALGQMTSASAAAVERTRRIMREYEQARGGLMKQLDHAEDPHLAAALDNIFSYGRAMGEASETALAINEQMDVIRKDFAHRRKMESEALVRDEEQRKLNNARTEHGIKLAERQTEALEALVTLTRERNGTQFKGK